MVARMLTCNLGAGKLESCGPAPAPAVRSAKLRLCKLAVPDGQTKWVGPQNSQMTKLVAHFGNKFAIHLVNLYPDLSTIQWSRSDVA